MGNAQGFKEEIWAFGLRNPWKFSFDSLSGDLWAGDVGQDSFEEIDIIKSGLNYGWNTMEGFHCFSPPEPNCSQTGLELPVFEYGRDDGCSITGGYVYRGSRLPDLVGAYVYGDFCSGRIWGLRNSDSTVTEQGLLVDSSLSISSFGVDEQGELYVLDFGSQIHRLRAQGQTPQNGTISGSVTLQGRTSSFPVGVGHGIVSVTLDPGGTSASTGVDGSFALPTIPPGTFTLTASAAGYLSAQRAGVLLQEGATLVIPGVQLRAGLVNGDNVDNINDITATVASFGKTVVNRQDAQGRVVDINGDGVVNINDITAVVSNFGKTSPQSWP